MRNYVYESIFTFPKIRRLLDSLRQLQRRPCEHAHNKRVVVVSSFSSVLHMLKRLIAQTWRVDIYDGQTSLKDRAQIQEAFNNGNEHHILLLSKAAGGVGLNLCAAHMFVMNPSHTFIEEEQVVSRIRRLGQSHHVTVHALVTKGGLEDMLRTKQLQQIDGMASYIGDVSDYYTYFTTLELSATTTTPTMHAQQSKKKRSREDIDCHPTLVLLNNTYAMHVKDTEYTPLPTRKKRCVGCSQRVDRGSEECTSCRTPTTYTCVACNAQQSISYDVCQSCRMVR